MFRIFPTAVPDDGGSGMALRSFGRRSDFATGPIDITSIDLNNLEGEEQWTTCFDCKGSRMRYVVLEFDANADNADTDVFDIKVENSRAAAAAASAASAAASMTAISTTSAVTTTTTTITTAATTAAINTIVTATPAQSSRCNFRQIKSSAPSTPAPAAMKATFLVPVMLEPTKLCMPKKPKPSSSKSNKEREREIERERERERVRETSVEHENTRRF